MADMFKYYEQGRDMKGFIAIYRRINCEAEFWENTENGIGKLQSQAKLDLITQNEETLKLINKRWNNEKEEVLNAWMIYIATVRQFDNEIHYLASHRYMNEKQEKSGIDHYQKIHV